MVHGSTGSHHYTLNPRQRGEKSAWNIILPAWLDAIQSMNHAHRSGAVRRMALRPHETAPSLQSLAYPPEAHQRNVIVLAAATGELFNDLDHLLNEGSG